MRANINAFFFKIHRIDKVFASWIQNNRCQRGISLVEVLLISAVLAGVAIGGTLLLTQSQTVRRSTAQTSACSTLARETLEKFVTFGTRLYGYSYHKNAHTSSVHQLGHPKFRPLLLTSGSPPQNVAGCTTRPCRDKAKLKFPAMLENFLSQNLSVNMATPTGAGDWVNTGKDIIKVVKSGGKKKIHLGSSIFLINQVNVLQYLYNSDNEFFKGSPGSNGMGKKLSLKDGSSLQKYKDKFGLHSLDFYVLIRPVDLKKHKVITNSGQIKCGRLEGGTYTSVSCPNHPSGSHPLILTRPRLSESLQQKIPPYVVLHGNPYMGFEIKVILAYKRSAQDQTMSCDVMQTFTHSMNTFKKDDLPPSDIKIISITNGAGTGMDSDGDGDNTLLTSCDTHGSGYKDISIELDFGVSAKERGSLLICRGIRECVSGDSTDTNYSSKKPPTGFSPVSCQYSKGDWTRCHDVQFPGQTSNTVAVMTAENKLKLTFRDLPENIRYDLQVAELSMAGTQSQILTPIMLNSGTNGGIGRFYIDSSRPYIGSVNLDDNVGVDPKTTKGSSYSGDDIPWAKPGPLDSGGKWLQCNLASVEVKATVEDQLTHNLNPCSIKVQRQDGTGTTTRNICNKYTDGTRTGCRGPVKGGCGPYKHGVTPCESQKETGSGDVCHFTVREIAHGRHTVKITPKDSCGDGPTRTVVWDTDDPNTFESKPFTEKKFRKTDSPYTVTAQLPAKAGAGTFPKHWTVRCFEEYWPKAKKDGNGGSLECKLLSSRGDVDDGCNPAPYGAKYFHVCGKTEDQGCQWSVYAPHTKSCENVDCEPELICCDGKLNDCGNAGGKGQCGKETPKKTCDTPKNGDQDLNSGCPPLGLYSCPYTVRCIAGGRSETCSSRYGDPCTITWPCPTAPGGMCSANGSCSSKSGGCTKKGSKSLTGNCKADKCIDRPLTTSKCPGCSSVTTPTTPPVTIVTIPPVTIVTIPPTCTGQGEYKDEAACIAGPPALNTATQECYDDNGCWKRKNKSTCTGQGEYKDEAACIAGPPALNTATQECYEDNGCWKRKNKTICKGPCTSCHTNGRWSQKRIAYWRQDQPPNVCNNLNRLPPNRRPPIQWRSGGRCNHAQAKPSGHSHRFQASRCNEIWDQTNEYHYLDTLSDGGHRVIKHTICQCQ